MEKLNRQQTLFCIEYIKDFNATQAAIRAGYSPHTAAEQGSRLLNHVQVAKEIQEHLDDAAAAAGVTVAQVLRQWLDIARADPSEFMRIDVACCRHCYGNDFQYQWTQGEYTRAYERAIERGKPVPDGMGGFGYNPNTSPNPECPECAGHGEAVPRFLDTRNVSGPSRRLFAGVQKTKDGLKVILRDQDAAVANLAKYLGMMVDRKEISGPNGGAIPVANLKAEDFTDAQLAAMIAAEQTPGQ
jgi:phage terminase small subunit